MNSKSKAPFQRSLARDYATISPRKKVGRVLMSGSGHKLYYKQGTEGRPVEGIPQENHSTPEALFLKSRKSNLG